MKKLNIGILAHVDAGKTTLTESLLHLSGAIRQKGRVDHKDAFLDFTTQERNRGITIFSKQASFTWQNCEFTLIDTPGHVDFSSEMERTLQVLDYAILLIQANDGIQAHTETIWNLLRNYQVPTFLLINKIDIAHQSQQEILKELQATLHKNCINFNEDIECLLENIAMSDESLLERYLQTSEITNEQIAQLISNQTILPCFFGSALKSEGIEHLLQGLQKFTIEKTYPDEFGAIIYKVSHDEQENRLVHMKITGGKLVVKAKLSEEDKVDQIRWYQGAKYELLQEATAGMVCVIKGCKSLQAGAVLGIQPALHQAQLSSFMDYQVTSNDCDCFTLLQYLKQMSEEDPQLHIRYLSQQEEIRIQLMGEVQMEIIQQQLLDRFHVKVEMDQGTVLYKETIAEAVEGIGHFEPLRHYAEVHILLEPTQRNSGIQCCSQCSQDELAMQWQRTILTHLQEKEHVGVLTGSPITDMKLTLLTGKAHEKHTEGGDFRQATYRAVRQGLKQAKSVLLEPYMTYSLEIPETFISKAIFDIEQMHGTFKLKDGTEGMSILEGEASAVNLQQYQLQVTSYTSGKGRLRCTFKGYEPCYRQEEIVSEIAYQSETDLDNPTGSIFCQRGAGFYVPWDQVPSHMHVHSTWERKQKNDHIYTPRKKSVDEKDLEQIYINTYGPIKRRSFDKTPKELTTSKQLILQQLPECLLVDGYNLLHTWAEIEHTDIEQLDQARSNLIHALCSYQAYKKCLLILVFDAYKVEENNKEIIQKDQIYIVYTKHAQTADMYIERATHELANQYRVTVATSDGMEQLITMGQGARRMSSRQLLLDMRMQAQYHNELNKTQKRHRTYLLKDILQYEEDESVE